MQSKVFQRDGIVHNIGGRLAKGLGQKLGDVTAAGLIPSIFESHHYMVPPEHH